MIDALKGWVMNVCTAIFFITAVEMILPSNSMKKYTKFVLGLILITVLINPIIKIFNNDFNIDNYIDAASEYFDNKKYEKNYEKYKNSSIDNTTEVFASNLENMCTQKLKEKYPKDNYKVGVEVKYDDKKEEFIINEIKVGVSEGKVKKIEKVNIGNSKEVNGQETIDDKKSHSIVEYLSEIISIPKEKIKVYKL
ncbi:stage III sporulation protein AF [Clostridium sp.]|jgi:stage III sporulation protein AF|uniref:stage III sporulation protein AF n=1 Tax=Clostridium sp. TaxID=1506 RepID=UPI0039F619E6